MAMQGMMGGHIQTEHWIVMELCTRGSLQVTQQEALNDARMQHTQCLWANTPQMPQQASSIASMGGHLRVGQPNRLLSCMRLTGLHRIICQMLKPSSHIPG